MTNIVPATRVLRRRDATGFSLDDQPSITQQQLIWLTHRLEQESDEAACVATYASDCPIDVELPQQWLAEPVFREVYQSALANKREAFRYLGGQLLPKAIRVLVELLDSPTQRNRVEGLKLLLRSQGLLIDRAPTTDSDTVVELVARLREPRGGLRPSTPVQTINGFFTPGQTNGDPS